VSIQVNSKPIPAAWWRFVFFLASAVCILASLPAAALAVPPPNDDFVNAQVLNGSPAYASGTNIDANKEPGEPNHAGNAGGASVWYTWTAPASGKMTADLCYSSNFDTLLAVYTGSSVSALTPVAQNDDSCGLSGNQSLVGFNVTSGTNYWIAVDGVPGSAAGGTGLFTLALRPPPPNDDFANAETLTGSFAFLSSINSGATKESGEPDHAGNAGGASIWYRWTAPATGSVTIDVCDSTFDTLLAVYTGSIVSALTPVAQNDDSCGLSGNQSLVGFNVTSGTNYWIAVDGYASEMGQINLSLEFVEAPPPCPPPEVPPGATYRGSNSRGGIVCFTVTANWSAVTSFLITDLRGDGGSCTIPWARPPFNPPLAINNRSFSGSLPRRGGGTDVSGSFDTGKGATGRFRFHVASSVSSCDTGVVSWNASTTATPPWALPVKADTTAPALRLRARSSQRAVRQKGIVVEVRCPTEACTATAQGTVSVPGAARTYRLKSATKQIRRGGKAKLKLKFSKKTLKVVKRALSKRKKIKARVTVTVKDAAGNRTTKKRSIRLKR
jgi:hypothetical protein